MILKDESRVRKRLGNFQEREMGEKKYRVIGNVSERKEEG